MKVKIHRGVGQIGGCIVEVSAFDKKRRRDTKIMLDCGRNLPPLDDPRAVDNMEIKGLTSGDSKYDAVFVTHHHADHCGLLGRVNNDIPIYMSSITKGVLDIVSDFINRRPLRAIETITEGEWISVHNMRIMPLIVSHSARGAVMYLVEANGKRVLYTGDFNDIEENSYRLIKETGTINALLCEGTNIEIENEKTEENVLLRAVQIMEQTNEEIFVLCSTTNINRIEAIASACNACSPKRTMVIDQFMNAILKQVGYNIRKTIQINRFMSYFVEKGESPRIDKHIWCKDFIPGYIKADELAAMQNLTIMVRQSMGKFLVRLGRHKLRLKIEGKAKDCNIKRDEVIEQKPFSNSTLIYSMWTGYKGSKYTSDFLKLCTDLGMKIEDLHISGHAYREQIKTAIEEIDPITVIPIHTENEEAYKGLHKNITTIPNGKTWSVV